MPRKNQCSAFNICNGFHRCKSNIYKGHSMCNKQYCFVHYNYILGNAAKVIQNIYRSNKKRRFINIYKKLPGDLQNKVLFYIQEGDLIKKHHHEVIEDIILSRYNTLQQKRVSINAFGVEKKEMKTYLDEFYDLLKLIKKYKDILSLYSHHLLAMELKQMERQILNNNIIHYIGLENELYFTINRIASFCLDINNNQSKNNTTFERHKLYHDNLINYNYYITTVGY